MAFEIVFDPQAEDDVRRLRAHDRTKILDWMDRILAKQPTQISKSRIKRLREIESPQYRLRVDDFRVFYDVRETEVYVFRVLEKSKADDYLRECGYEPQSN